MGNLTNTKTMTLNRELQERVENAVAGNTTKSIKLAEDAGVHFNTVARLRRGENLSIDTLAAIENALNNRDDRAARDQRLAVQLNQESAARFNSMYCVDCD